jgi:hypothetical protein
MMNLVLSGEKEMNPNLERLANETKDPNFKIQDLKQQIFEALKGTAKFPKRKYEVEGKYGDDRSTLPEETKSWTVTRYDHHFTEGYKWGQSFKRNELEALVLIPEDFGLAKVERVYNSSGAVGGFYTPQYAEEALQAIIDAYSRVFAEEGEIFKKSWWFHPISTMLPDEMKRFAQHRDRIIAGIKNAYFDKKKGYKNNDAALDNLAGVTKKMGINHATDQEFMKVFWDKIKENPNGFVGTGAWGAVAEYIMENNPQMVIEFDGLRRGIAEHSLPEMLWVIPVNQEAETDEIKRRGNLPAEVYVPILKAVEKTIIL